VTDGYSGVELSASPPNIIGVHAGRTSGSGNLDIDFLLFVPADDRLALVTWGANTGPDTYVLDSAASRAYGTLSGAVSSELPYAVAGGPPMVSVDGAVNRVWFIRDVGATNLGSDAITGSRVITPYYWPRYLGVARPVAS
jgi:hypothetical protein